MMKRRMLLAIFALCVSCFAVGCGEGSSVDAEVKEEKKEEIVYLEESEISDFFADPNAYKGKYIKLSGKIFNGPDSEDGYVAYQAWHDIDGNNNDFVFGMEDSGEQFQPDDYVIVDGKISGTFEGENAFGGTVTSPIINAISVEKQSYIEAVVPTIKELTPESAVFEQHGVSLKVDKIEFAEDETRIYLTETNSSTDKFSMWVYSMKIVQNGQQIEQGFSSSSYEGDYPELASEILPNASSSGIVVFPALDSSASFQIYAEGSSDNWELDFTPFTIDITAQ